LVLHRNDGLQKDIVERLGFHAHVQLLDSKRKASRLLFARTKDNVETGLRQTGELAEAASREKRNMRGIIAKTDCARRTKIAYVPLNQGDFGGGNDEAAGNAHGLVIGVAWSVNRLVLV